MTYKQIFDKFMIEYDKATVTTSYPSLTTDEQAVILDKAYLALIAQKFTGNNARRSAFETDIKSVSDLQPLITIDDNLASQMGIYTIPADNVSCKTLPEDFLYFVSATLHPTGTEEQFLLQLVSHKQAEKFFKTRFNKPWVRTPVCYIEDGKIYVVVDSTKLYYTDTPRMSIDITLTYIKFPDSFKNHEADDTNSIEINDQLTEELISIAVMLALENVESPRLNAKIQTKGLES